jgi:hypothetical protein
MWSVAYWFVSPFQLLLIFLGRIEPERSSDWLIRRISGGGGGGEGGTNNYTSPAALPASLLVCFFGGLATAVVSSAALGSATWAVAGGLGALAAAAFIEIGRPKQLDEREAKRMWQRSRAFAQWAPTRLSASSGARCHEREILAAFRRDAGVRRAARRAERARERGSVVVVGSEEEEEEEQGVAVAATATATATATAAAAAADSDDDDDDDASWDEQTIRELVRAWAPPGAERSRSGYWRGVGLLASSNSAGGSGGSSR